MKNNLNNSEISNKFYFDYIELYKTTPLEYPIISFNWDSDLWKLLTD